MIIPRSPQGNQIKADSNVQNIILNTRKSNTKVKRNYNNMLSDSHGNILPEILPESLNKKIKKDNDSIVKVNNLIKSESKHLNESDREIKKSDVNKGSKKNLKYKQSGLESTNIISDNNSNIKKNDSINELISEKDADFLKKSVNKDELEEVMTRVITKVILPLKTDIANLKNTTSQIHDLNRINTKSKRDLDSFINKFEDNIMNVSDRVDKLTLLDCKNIVECSYLDTIESKKRNYDNLIKIYNDTDYMNDELRSQYKKGPPTESKKSEKSGNNFNVRNKKKNDVINLSDNENVDSDESEEKKSHKNNNSDNDDNSDVNMIKNNEESNDEIEFDVKSVRNPKKKSKIKTAKKVISNNIIKRLEESYPDIGIKESIPALTKKEVANWEKRYEVIKFPIYMFDVKDYLYSVYINRHPMTLLYTFYTDLNKEELSNKNYYEKPIFRTKNIDDIVTKSNSSYFFSIEGYFSRSEIDQHFTDLYDGMNKLVMYIIFKSSNMNKEINNSEDDQKINQKLYVFIRFSSGQNLSKAKFGIYNFVLVEDIKLTDIEIFEIMSDKSLFHSGYNLNSIEEKYYINNDGFPAPRKKKK